MKGEDAVYTSYTFEGHGWGHRVGMSQWGAYSMAMLGFNYEDILNFYFTDIEIEENEVEAKAEGTYENVYTEQPEQEEYISDGRGYLSDEELEEYEEESEEESTDDDETQWSDTGI